MSPKVRYSYNHTTLRDATNLVMSKHLKSKHLNHLQPALLELRDLRLARRHELRILRSLALLTLLTLLLLLVGLPLVLEAAKRLADGGSGDPSLLLRRIIETRGRLLFERDIGVVLYSRQTISPIVRRLYTHVHALGLCLRAHDDTGGLQLALLLEHGETARLLELAFARLALRLLALCICQTRTSFR